MAGRSSMLAESRTSAFEDVLNVDRSLEVV